MKSADALEKSLAAMGSASDVRGVHRARIGAKRLRYVSEKVAPMVPEGDALIKSLEQLQDVLGDLHDVHVLAADLRRRSARHGAKGARARQPGLRALRQRLDDRRTVAFALVEHTWLHARADPFFSRARALAREISRLAEGKSPDLSSALAHKGRVRSLPLRTVEPDSLH